ncbi:hypothetical protein ASE17_20400 [Phenylobacterium sp. Root77]|jgi:predicted transcriptional regulator|uniref:MucR family transcriptional regulator n=1 Tax=unclassified Phenylobacterium TaxID=2640670 RepID=UPI0006F7B9C3|nr:MULTISPECIES: MucR family transcriptional regulator [unclassified Phenylobacterium]KQW67059.1 hypothetical protein ASC73_18205 [Phenylobacterium sp. Root1277]KQW89752.1 hypothetical protein ASC79_19110 [Phenylobacterium sp. Root1290]KRC43559.1 hypothetical protein ASE17_20400 [Phenylobacterium sp. Root77]
MEERNHVLAGTTQIITAFVSHNLLNAQDLPALIAKVHGAFRDEQVAEPAVAKATASQIRRSITPDALISFIDGKPYKVLTRHLAMHGFTISEYRNRYGLPADYPSTAPAYSAVRSAAAKAAGLGGALGSTRSKTAAAKRSPTPR